MDIQKLTEIGGHIVLPITMSDLQQIVLFTIEQTRQALVREIADAKNEVYYSVDQVVAILNVSKMTLWRWAQPDKNYLIPIRVGGLPRYRKSDIDKLLGKVEK